MTKQQLLQKVKNEIALRKSASEKKSEQAYHDALKNPAFHANDTNIRTVNLQIAKLEFQNKPTQTEQELLRVLNKERAGILKNMNLKESDLTPNYVCTKCNDTGICDGKYCKCFTSLVEKYLREDCCDSVNPEHTFRNSKTVEGDTQTVYEKLEKWCQKYPNKIINITLYGNTGTGKTYLTECITNELINKGVVVQYMTAFTFNNLATKYHTTFDETKNNYIDTLLDCDVLVIDDLGTEPINKNVTLEYLYLVINERQQNNRPTIITTNLSLEGVLSRYGERVFSRLNNKQLSLAVSLKGNDMRLNKK